jgi:hypothetical protein
MTRRLGGFDSVASIGCRLIGLAQAGHCGSRAADSGIGAEQGSGVRSCLVPARRNTRGARDDRAVLARLGTPHDFPPGASRRRRSPPSNLVDDAL